MEKRPKPIGEILAELGLITEADVERALAHQRARGGYFGDALVELGLLSPEQVRFALADQYDLPFVHLRPESIDRRVAALVPAEWAREHLMIPVLRDGDTVTVTLTVPPTEQELAAVRRFTRAARVEAAVSTAETIHALIDAVHGEGAGTEIALAEWVTRALEVGARAVGLSARGSRVRGWYRAEATVWGRIGGGWAAELRRVVYPWPASQDEPRRWPAVLACEAGLWRAECCAVAAAGALEWSAQIATPLATGADGPAASPELRSAVGTALRGGGATLCVDHDGADAERDDEAAAALLEAVLPALPGAVLDDRPRSAHLADRPVAVLPGTLVLRATQPLAAALAALEPFRLDALTLDIERLTADDLAAARRSARCVAFRRHPTQPPLAADLDVRLRRADTPLWIPAA